MCAELCVCMQVWDFATGEILRTLKGHTCAVWSVAISPCGKYVVSGSSDKTVKVITKLRLHCAYLYKFAAKKSCCTLGL